MGRLTRMRCLYIYTIRVHVRYSTTSEVSSRASSLSLPLSFTHSLHRADRPSPVLYTSIYTCGMSIVRASSCSLTDPRARRPASCRAEGDGRESRVFYLSLKNFASEFHLRSGGGGGDDGKPSAETNCSPLSWNKTN